MEVRVVGAIVLVRLVVVGEVVVRVASEVRERVEVLIRMPRSVCDQRHALECVIKDAHLRQKEVAAAGSVKTALKALH